MLYSPFHWQSPLAPSPPTPPTPLSSLPAPLSPLSPLLALSLLPLPPRSLPLELWEKVIDFVAGGTHSLSISTGRDVTACCLVCRAFVPRCRFYLILPTHGDFAIQSRTRLARVVQTLSNFPALWARLDKLIIDAGNGVDQSWISTVPFCLPLSIFRLNRLALRGVDLSVLHPEAHRGFSRIRIDEVLLCDVRYSSYTQLTRFFSISNTVAVYDQQAMTIEVAALRRLPPRQGPQRFTLQLSWARHVV